jgi:O-antigen biosynthesis protein WbqV
LFEAQLAGGGPLTVTHADMTRYFLSIPQAADSLLQAAAKGLSGSRRGAAKVIEMGEALPVVELARNVIRLAALRPDEDVRVVFTGLRPGEKLHERLVAHYEWLESDADTGVIAAMSQPRTLPDLHDLIEQLVLLARQGADDELRVALFDAIAEQQEGEELAAVG